MEKGTVSLAGSKGKDIHQLHDRKVVYVKVLSVHVYSGASLRRNGSIKKDKIL